MSAGPGADGPMVPWSHGPGNGETPCNGHAVPMPSVPWPPPAVPGPICRDTVQIVAALVISDLLVVGALSSGCEHLGLSQ